MSLAIPLGPFDLYDPIGKGGMGVVWRGVHRASGLPVAVKALRGDRAWDERLLDLFAIEVRAVAGMNHPGIVLVLDHGAIPRSTEEASEGLIPAGSPYLAMELAGGGTLLDRAGLLEWPELLELSRCLLGALGHAHARGVVHRDLKPGNVLLSAPGDLRQGPRLTDFGIAWLPPAPTEEDGAQPEGFFGSPSYIAPEQIDASRGPIGPWTDLYSLGCLLWAITTGETVFTGGSGMKLAARHLTDEVGEYRPLKPVRRGFEPWLRALLTKAPHRRFQRAADAAWWLDRVDPTRPRLTPSGGAARGPWSTDPQRRRPPVPFDWRPTEPTPPPLRLEGAGLGLFGIRRVPMVGRSEERDRLWDALRDVDADGAMRVVLLRGESGHGKSALARWIAERAEELGAGRSVWAVHGPTGGPGTGLGPMLSRLLRSRGMTPSQVRERAEERLRRLGSDEPYVWHGLGRLVAPDDEGGFPTPTERYAVAGAYLGAEARQRPLVLILDDVQWGDDVLRLVDHLLRQDAEQPLPLLIVATAREEALVPGSPAALFLNLLAARPSVETVHVGPLDPSASAELVQELLGLHGALAADVVERAGGNPMFAVQLVGDWVQRGLLEVRDGSFALRDGAAAQVPDDIHDVWRDRFERALGGAEPDARRAVEIAAALGVEVDIKEWSLACLKGGFVVPQGLVGTLARAALITPDAAGFSFVHGMARESVERSAREAGRWAGHNSAAADAVLARALDQDAERGAMHLLAAGRLVEAAEQLAVAAEHRVTIGEYDAGEGLMGLREQTLERLGVRDDDPRMSRAMLQRARLQRLRGRTDEGAAWAEEARRTALIGGMPEVMAPALRELGIHARGERRLDEARSLFEQSVALYEEVGDDASAAAAYRSLGFVFRIQGDYDRAREAFRRALASHEEAGDLRAASLTLSALAGTWLETGDVERAEALLRRSLELIQGTGFLRGLERTWQDLAAVLLTRNKLAEAAELNARARSIADKLGRASSIGAIANQQGEIARRRGDLGGAEAAYRDALKAYGDARAMTVVPRVNLALILRAQGEWGEVRPILELARTEAAEQGRRGIIDIIDALVLPCYARDGDWAAFDRCVEDLTAFEAGAARVDEDAALSLELAADFARDRGDAERSRRALRLAADRWRALGRPDRAEQAGGLGEPEETTFDGPLTAR